MDLQPTIIPSLYHAAVANCGNKVAKKQIEIGKPKKSPRQN